MQDKKEVEGKGCIRASTSIGSLITMLFIVLKLFGVIHWSWVWVTSPLWIVVALSYFFTFIEIIFTKKSKNHE